MAKETTILKTAKIGMQVAFVGRYAPGGGTIDRLTAQNPKLTDCVRVLIETPQRAWRRWIWRGYLREA